MKQRERPLPSVVRCEEKLLVATDSPLVFLRRLRYQTHMANDSIDKLARTLAETLPAGLRSVRDDVETNFRAALQAGLGRLDLVTREEFEVQQAVLARTREKLQDLEMQVAGLEKSKPAKWKATKKKVAKKKVRRKKASRKTRP